MGEGQETQQRRMRISPEAREKIKTYGKGAALLVAGVVVGASIRTCACDEGSRENNAPQPVVAAYCPHGEGNGAQREGELACFSDMMRKFFNTGDTNAKYAIEILYLISENARQDGYVEESLVMKVKGFAQIVARASQERSHEAFELIREALIRGGMRGMDPIMIIGIVEEMAKKAGDKDIFMDSLSTFSNRIGIVSMNSWMEVEPLDAGMADRILGMFRFARERAGEGHAVQAVSALKNRIKLISAAEGIPTAIEIAVGDARGADVTKRIDSIPFDHRLQLISSADYLAGVEMASELLGRQRPDMSCFHFAYGISKIGEDGVRALHGEFGIHYFLRYTEMTLKKMLGNARGQNQGDGPVFLAVVANSDWNGALYSEQQLEQLIGHYRLFVIEVMAEVEFYRKAREIYEKYGKISGMVLGGHGSESFIDFGGYGERGMVDPSDVGELRRLRDIFVETPTLVLNSCSTGRYRRSIGGMLSVIFGAHVFAPTRPSDLVKYLLDGEGRISGVEYDVPTREYLNGESWIMPDASP